MPQSVRTIIEEETNEYFEIIMFNERRIVNTFTKLQMIILSNTIHFFE